MNLIEISNLDVIYKLPTTSVKALSGISLSLEEGDFFGLIGESGCGKTTVAKAITKLLPSNGEITNGSILFKGKDISKMTEGEFRHLRWKEISIVPQSAMNSLDPVYNLGTQMVEAISSHKRINKREAWKRAEEMFQLVNINPERLKDYPHQFSGGMKQRAIIGMSLILNPSLIIADEPTTGLDVIVQDQIFIQFTRLLKELKKTLFLITHDVSIVVENCDRVAVMYGGKIVEYGNVKDVFKIPFHPYTMGLQNAFPSTNITDKALISIPGYPPDLTNPPRGCPFSMRCPFSDQLCEEKMPAFVEVGIRHFSLCHYVENADKFRILVKDQNTWLQKE